MVGELVGKCYKKAQVRDQILKSDEGDDKKLRDGGMWMVGSGNKENMV